MKRSLFTRVIAMIAAITMFLTGVPNLGDIVLAAGESSTYSLSKDTILNVSELDDMTTTPDAGITFGRFTLTKGLTIEASEKTGEGNLSFTKRLKTNGTSTADNRAVHFTTTRKATLTVYAMSGSSSANRVLGLYKADGTKVADIPVLGTTAEIPAVTVEISEAGNYYLGSTGSGINIYYVNLEEEPELVLVNTTLDVSSLTPQEIEETTTINGYTIVAGTKASSANVTIEANAQTGAGNLDFINRLKLNGTGTKTKRSIHFTTEGEATLTVYALSGSSSADRKLNLYDAATDELVGTVDAFGTANPIPAATIEITKAGTYYLMSPSSGINIYRLNIAEMKEGTAEPERPEWASVASPELVSVGVNPSNKGEVLVDWKMDVSEAGADRVEAVLLDENGNEDTKAVHRTEGSAGTLTLKPTKSGNFTVVLKAYRGGEEEVKVSNSLALTDYVRPLDSFSITKALTGKNNSLVLGWGKVSEASSYTVSYKEVGTDNEVIVESGITDTEYTITSGLTALKEYQITVTAVRGEERVTASMNKVLQAEAERWLAGHVGSGSKGSTITVNKDGSITIENTSGKIAESEDQFSFYYTEIDPKTENFTLTATFKVESSSNKDNQSGFGIMAVDSLDTVNDARYMNSVGAMVSRFTVDAVNKVFKYGIPGLRTINGYTGLPTDSQPGQRVMDATKPFDWDFNLAKVSATTNVNQPRFFDGETYTFSLRRSNTGYHANFTDENGKVYEEQISWDETLLEQDKDSIYVGFAVGRKIKVTVTDYKLTTITPEEDDAPLERPISYFDATFSSDTTRTTATVNYKPVFVSNVAGSITIKDEAGKVLATDVAVKAKERVEVPVALVKGTNNLSVEFTPASKENQNFAPYTDLSSYDTIVYPMQVIVNNYGTSDNAIYVSPNGTANGLGTKASPLDVYTAVAYAQAGQEIVLLGGEYNLSKGIVISRGNDGEKDNRITLMSDPDERAVLNFANSTSGGIILKADYWHIYDLEIKNTKAGKPMHVQGSNNIVEKLLIHDNADTGLQISGSAEEPYAMWPSYNLIQSVEVYNSCDPLANDADGFAAKITVGDGNVFRYCIAHHNIDDGWDLYAKSTSGSIGQVVIDSCVAYSNGILTADVDKGLIGEGNGFKLGGESMPGNHILKNSITFNNHAKGVTSNSGPDPQVINVTSFNNGGENLALYTNAATTNYIVQGFISMNPGAADRIEVKGQSAVEGSTIYLNGINKDGVTVKADWFTSTAAVVPTYNVDGTINLGDFLKLTDSAPTDAGARFVANPNPTEIEIGTEINTVVPTPEPTVAPTATPEPTVAPTATPVPTVAPTATPVPTVAPTATPVPAVNISSATIGSIKNQTYTGKAITPAVTVKIGSKTLKAGTDYTVSYKNNTKVGTATVTVKGKGNYTGTKSKTFKIVTKSISKGSVTIKKQEYTGKPIKAPVVLKVDGRTLKLGTDYTVSYKNNTKIGKATVVIKGKGNYSGTKTASFNIALGKVTLTKAVSTKSKTVTVTWKKVYGVTGYQVVYATSKNGTYRYSGSPSKLTRTIKDLKAGQTVYVKVRAYRVLNGKVVYGSYSTPQAVKVK